MNRTALSLTYLMLTAEIVAFTVITFLIFLPLVSNTRTAQGERAVLESRLTERQHFLQSLDRKRLALEQKSSDEELLAVALPTDDAFESVLRLLHRGADASGTIINDVRNTSNLEQRLTTTQRAQGEAVNLPSSALALGAEISASGTYQQLRVFLEQIERSPRLMDITELALRRPENQSDILEMLIKIRFYQHQSLLVSP
jgi:Tfp pilus assembly protein PilO